MSISEAKNFNLFVDGFGLRFILIENQHYTFLFFFVLAVFVCFDLKIAG